MLHFPFIIFTKHLRINSILLLIFLSSIQISQGTLKVLHWNVHTSFTNAIDATVDENSKIYLSTQGGLLIYDAIKSKSQIVNSGNGLWDNELTCVYYYPRTKHIIAGSNLGALYFIDKDLKITTILDVTKSNFANKSIRSITSHDTKLYIATGFGALVFDTEKMIFLETISKFGQFSPSTQANKVFIANNTIYIATNEGVAYNKLGSQLQNPMGWRTISIGFKTTQFIDGIAVNDGLYFATKNDVYKLVGDSLVFVLSDLVEIKNLINYNGRMAYTTGFAILDNLKNRIAPDPLYPSNRVIYNENLKFSNSETFIYLYRELGLGYILNNKQIHVMPNSPISNLFWDLSTDDNGNLWVGTGKGPSKGLMRFDGEKWTNYTTDLNKDMSINNVVSVYSHNDSIVYASTWGRGIMKLNYKSNKIEYLNRINSPLTGISTDPDWIVIGKINRDNQGNLWAVNYGETSSGPLLVAMDKSGKFYEFNNCRNSTDRWYLDMVIDDNGTKWVASTLSGGLIYFNEKNTLDNPNDDICGTLLNSSFPSLPSNEQTSLALDLNGILWIGTPNGLASIYNPSAIVLGQKPIVRNIKSLSQQSINDIYVDAVDNKWIATNEGVWVLNPDASEVLAIFNKDNSPLLTNRIRTISGNSREGRIYIGTDIGLYELVTLSVEPFDDYQIKCYPQPFMPRNDVELIIDGLANQSEIWITTTSGNLIKRISTNSRRIVWDGTDENGNLVGTGVYLINAQSRLTNKNAVQKVAVIVN